MLAESVHKNKCGLWLGQRNPVSVVQSEIATMTGGWKVASGQSVVFAFELTEIFVGIEGELVVQVTIEEPLNWECDFSVLQKDCPSLLQETTGALKSSNLLLNVLTHWISLWVFKNL